MVGRLGQWLEVGRLGQWLGDWGAGTVVGRLGGWDSGWETGTVVGGWEAGTVVWRLGGWDHGSGWRKDVLNRCWVTPQVFERRLNGSTCVTIQTTQFIIITSSFTFKRVTMLTPA